MFGQRIKLIITFQLKALSQNPSQSSTGGFSLWKPANNDEKLEKLGTYIPQLVKKVETHQDKLECANESLRSDLERWHIEKRQCLEKILLDFVNKQVNYYQASLNAWESVTNFLNQKKGKFVQNGSK